MDTLTEEQHFLAQELYDAIIDGEVSGVRDLLARGANLVHPISEDYYLVEHLITRIPQYPSLSKVALDHLQQYPDQLDQLKHWQGGCGRQLIHLLGKASNLFNKCPQEFDQWLALCPDVNARNLNGRTPLFECSWPMVKPLLDMGLDIYAQDSKGYTPMSALLRDLDSKVALTGYEVVRMNAWFELANAGWEQHQDPDARRVLKHARSISRHMETLAINFTHRFQEFISWERKLRLSKK